MATPHLHAGVVQRSKGGSAVGAAAYAARVRLLDQRTGLWHDYSDSQADVMHQGVYLPKGAPERLRDLQAFANALEAAEDRKDSQTARKFVVALPAELTEQQRLWLLQDYGRETFTRKGLAYHAAIHRPHAHGDDRNFHAHITVSMRTLDAAGFAEMKDAASDRPQALAAWRANWAKMTNHHLERHGHEARIDMRTLEAQGIDRMPQIHLGQHAAAAERKGTQTERGDRLREIINDNDRLRVVVNEQKRTVGAEFSHAAGPEVAHEVISPPPPRKPAIAQQPQDWTAGKLFARDEIKAPQREASNENRPETIDRDAEAARSQDAIDSAAVAYAEEQRRQLHQTQGVERAAYEGQREAMTERHAATWGEAVHRHAVEMASVAPASYQPGTMEDAGQAATTGFAAAFGFLSFIVGGLTGSTRRQAARDGQNKPAKRDTERREQEKRDQHQQEINAIMAEQAHERESYERRKAAMLQDQQRAREHFEQQYADPSALQQAFDIHSGFVDRYRAEAERMAAYREAQQERDGPEFEGPELGG